MKFDIVALNNPLRTPTRPCPRPRISLRQGVLAADVTITAKIKEVKYKEAFAIALELAERAAEQGWFMSSEFFMTYHDPFRRAMFPMPSDFSGYAVVKAIIPTSYIRCGELQWDQRLSWITLAQDDFLKLK